MRFPVRGAVRRVRRRIQEQVRRRAAPIYLIAAAGQPNFGDEFITRAWLDWLAAHHPHREVWLDCMEPGRAAHLFRDTHPRLRTTNTLWQVAHTDAPTDIEEAGLRMDALVSGLGSPKADFGLRDLRTMSSLHLLGGGYVNTLWPNNLAIVAGMTAVRRHFGVPIFATGQGLLPNEGATRTWLRAQLQQFDVAEARDERSAEAFGIPAGTDDAFLAFANKRPVYADPSELPEKMVLIQGDDMFDEARARSISDRITNFIADDLATDVGFAEAIPPEDMRYAGEFVSAGAHPYPFMRMWEEGFPARPGQEWLTSRFHFHLLAAAAGASGVVVDARPGYYDVKHELLERLGTGWNVLADLDADEAAPTRSDLFPAAARVWGAEKAQRAGLLYGTRRVPKG